MMHCTNLFHRLKGLLKGKRFFKRFLNMAERNIEQTQKFQEAQLTRSRSFGYLQSVAELNLGLPIL